MSDTLMKTYPPEIGDAILLRASEAFLVAWGLKICQWGTLASLVAATDLDTIVPCVLLELITAGQPGGGEAKLRSRQYDYLFRLRVVVPLEDDVVNPRALVVKTRDLHDIYNKGQLRLTIADVAPNSLSQKDCQAIAQGPDPDLMDVIGLGVMVGHVDVRVRTESNPYIP